MSPRVTRSSARLAADSQSISSETPTIVDPEPAQNSPPTARKRKAPGTDSATAAGPSAARHRTKKAKASEAPSTSPLQPARPKRQKAKATPPQPTQATMASNANDGENTRRAASSRRRQQSPPGAPGETSPPPVPSITNSRRKSSRKSGGGASGRADASGSSARRNKKSNKEAPALIDDPMNAQEDPRGHGDDPEKAQPSGSSEEGDSHEHDQDNNDEDDHMEDDDPFAGTLLSRMSGASSITNTLRALGGYMSGTTGRMRNILENLRMKEDPSVQLIALTELSQLLLISTEDNLNGTFSPDQVVKELIDLMQPNEFGFDNPEMMLLACRCIANLMEALPSATPSVVYGGAVPVLCQKLIEIDYIDLAEQALSTLEKISIDFPSSIVREGGLTACLTYLDFFATSTQRTAVTTAANCCRGIPDESFETVRDVMPILLNVLSSNDQKVVEQGSLCVCRIIESFKWRDERLEALVSEELLKAILRLLLPGTTNLIGGHIHTQFLRVLAIAARASPRISFELLKLNVVDTLYQIMTGISPPSGLDNIAAQIDKNVIMQALIRSPKDQIFETLNVACEMLPKVPELLMEDAAKASPTTRSRSTTGDKRSRLFREAPEQVRCFAVILFPTLMHAYTSTVNLHVREKVLSAQLKMLSNFDTKVLDEALSDIPFASHIASILSQRENPVLVVPTLQIADMLLNRLEHVYRFQFHREGVIAEIKKLAERPLASETTIASEAEPTVVAATQPQPTEPHRDILQRSGDHDEDDGEEDEDDDDDGEGEDDDSETDSEQGEAQRDAQISRPDIQDLATTTARSFINSVAANKSSASAKEASATVDELKLLGRQLQQAYATGDNVVGEALFQRLASYFSCEGSDAITSYELLESDTVGTLLSLLPAGTATAKLDAQTAFLRAFMVPSKTRIATGTAESPITAFSVLVHKLQDLLSRTENFEVITVHQNGFENSRNSAASMLAKQLRLRLSADEDSGIPPKLRNISVSIHAIARFKALDDYLRSRIIMTASEMPADLRQSRRALLSSIMAANRQIAQAGSSQSPAAQPANATRSSAPGQSTPPSARRSTRAPRSAQPIQGEPATPQRLERGNEGSADNQLECADESKLSDAEANTEAGNESIFDEVADDMDDEEEEEDESAVNVEVAKSGRVEAHREDGTRIATPQGSQRPSAAALASLASASASATAHLAAARELMGSPTTSRSYASAVAAASSASQDWHLEFSINGQPVHSDITIYRAVHFNQAEPEEVSSRVVWSSTHKITYKKVPGPPSSEQARSPLLMQSPRDENTGLPSSLSHHPRTAGILQLMSILHEMNMDLETLSHDGLDDVHYQKEPLTQFINTKLTAKLNRQLEEPLIVASACLPSWAEDLARLYPFLFPFESRHLFLQSTSFGYSRLMTRWQNSQSENQSRRQRDERLFLGRIQRQKVRISRGRLMESALKVMDLYGNSASILEVEYFEEVGTGLGPTLEFYANISREFSKKRHRLWRENESDSSSEYVYGKNGLFPSPLSAAQAQTERGKHVLYLWKSLGTFVARSMLDSRIIDIAFNPMFFRIGLAADFVPTANMVGLVDRQLAKVLKELSAVVAAKRKIDDDINLDGAGKAAAYAQICIKDTPVADLALDFTLPGYPDIELVPNGAQKDVTVENMEEYIACIVDKTLGSGVKLQLAAFKLGFSLVFPFDALNAFTPDELVMLYGKTEEDWSLETLMDSIKADHGFNLDSQSVKNLLQTMSEFDAVERRDFLQFVTGSPKLPIGGFKSLTPMFTVVCKPSEPPLTPDDFLPSVMTCVNYLKMPNYSTAEVLKAKLAVAIREGQGAFHLS